MYTQVNTVTNVIGYCKAGTKYDKGKVLWMNWAG